MPVTESADYLMLFMVKVCKPGASFWTTVDRVMLNTL